MGCTSLNMLHPLVRKWVWEQRWTSLKNIQEKSIPVILNGAIDVIISAPTAGGKTEAAFLPIISSILSSQVKHGVNTLYISPLKALINDQKRRLDNMTRQMDVKITPWHGDISVTTKKSFLSFPSGILIITPESLESFLVNKQQCIFDTFHDLKYIVVDELHSLLGNERGVQVLSLLARLESLIKRGVPRIVMSATLPNYSEVVAYIGVGHKIPCAVIEDKITRHDLRILLKYFEDANGEEMIGSDLYKRLRGANNLVFTNSRFAAETYAKELSAISKKNHVPNEFKLHHANVEKAQRTKIEKDMQGGNTPLTTICTSTLELGVDIGAVKSVAQIGNINSVASFRQRIGRSGRRDEPSIVRVYIPKKNRVLEELHLDLIQNISAVELMLHNRLESVVNDEYHFSTLIQQTLSLLAAHGSFYPQEAWLLLCRNGAFQNISPNIYLMLLETLANHFVINQRSNGQIIIGTEGEKILRQKDFYTAFYSVEEYSVIDLAVGREVGTIQEEVEKDEIIDLDARSWIVIKTDRKGKKIYVARTSKDGKCAFDLTNSFVEKGIVENMRQIYLSNDSYSYLCSGSNAINALLQSRESFYRLGLSSKSFIELNKKIYWFTWAGSKINNTLYLMINAILQKRVFCNQIYITDISVDDISKIYQKGRPSEIDLASIVDRRNKELQKYDYLLSDNLLNIEYAKKCMDLDGAWELINQAKEIR